MENQFPGKKLSLVKLNAEQTARRRAALEAFLQELFEMMLTPPVKHALEQFFEFHETEAVSSRNSHREEETSHGEATPTTGISHNHTHLLRPGQ